jgi:hypothetical protein
MSRKGDPVPDLLVERLALGDLDATKEAEVRARLAATGGLGRLTEIEASNRLILAAHPAAAASVEVQRRLGDETVAARRRPRLFWPSLSLGAAAALAVVVAVVQPRPKPEKGLSPATAGFEAEETIRSKGLRPHLIIYKKTPSGPARLDDTSRVRPGDTLQVAYVAAGRRFGMVLSQDARGSVTFHLPAGGGPAAALTDRGEVAAANAFELDDSPGFERFVFVTSDEPFQPSVGLEALRAKAKPTLPRGTTLTEIVLTKEIP